MATKTLTTRIALKTDTTANWSASTLVLLKGEQAIEIPESGEYKLKIGDGVNTFKDLPYVAMTPTEIKNLINSGAVQTVSLSSGTNNGTVKLTVDGTVTDNIAVKGLGSAAYTNSNAYATAGHGHSISGVSGLQAALDNKSAVGHTHDDRYYTESEMNTKLAGKANSSHTHGSGDITSLDASKLTGTINIERLPAGALERCVIVADDAARLKLTTKDVQKGDTVKVTATGKMYFVIDDSKLSTEDGYTVYTAGTATSVPWSGVTGKPSTFTPSAHRHVKADITDFPTSMPASDVYAWAKASTKPTYTKGEVGLGNVDNTADANKSVKYATSAGSATKLQTYKQGSTTETYGTDYLLFAQWENNSSVRLKIDNYTVKVNYADNAGIANSASSVDWSGVQNKPSTFTPSAHTHTIANITGLQNALNGKANSSHTHSIDNVTGLQSALDGKASSGHTHNLFSGEIHFSTGTYKDPADGISAAIKASGGIAADVFYEGLTKLSDKYQAKGSYAAASHTHTIAQITNLQTTLDGKSNNGHSHAISSVTGLQDALNGKAASSHTHTIANVTGLQAALDGKSNTNHGHTSITTYGVNTIGKVADDTAANWASKNNSIHFYTTDKLLNGQPSQYGFLFNMAQGGSELHQIWAAGGGSLYHRYGNASGIETTWREVLDSSSYTNYTVTKGGSGATGTWGISITGNAATASKCTGNAATATVADSAKACTGNSATATKLATARKIGNASFDGSADITLSAIGAASSGHTHNYAGSSSVGGAANSAVKLSTARAFSITGGATAAAVSFDGSAAVALNVTSVSTDVLNNGSNTLILSCGGAA